MRPSSPISIAYVLTLLSRCCSLALLAVSLPHPPSPGAILTDLQNLNERKQNRTQSDASTNQRGISLGVSFLLDLTAGALIHDLETGLISEPTRKAQGTCAYHDFAGCGCPDGVR